MPHKINNPKRHLIDHYYIAPIVSPEKVFFATSYLEAKHVPD